MKEEVFVPEPSPTQEPVGIAQPQAQQALKEIEDRLELARDFWGMAVGYQQLADAHNALTAFLAALPDGASPSKRLFAEPLTLSNTEPAWAALKEINWKAGLALEVLDDPAGGGAQAVGHLRQIARAALQSAGILPRSLFGSGPDYEAHVTASAHLTEVEMAIERGHISRGRVLAEVAAMPGEAGDYDGFHWQRGFRFLRDDKHVRITADGSDLMTIPPLEWESILTYLGYRKPDADWPRRLRAVAKTLDQSCGGVGSGAVHPASEFLHEVADYLSAPLTDGSASDRVTEAAEPRVGRLGHK